MVYNVPVSVADEATHLTAAAGVWVALKTSGTLAIMSSLAVDALGIGAT